MDYRFRYTAVRVRDLDAAIGFFTKVLGMKVTGRATVRANKGKFATLASKGETHGLELNWYADDSPVAGPFREGDELDHLGFQVDDFEAALARLRDAGYTPKLGPFRFGKWSVAHVPVIEGLWLDVFHIAKTSPRARKKPTSRASKKR